MKYTKGGFPFKTEKDDFLKKQNEEAVKPTDYLHRTPSIVASESAKEDYDADNEEVNKKETERINTTPNTRPPMFSDLDTHTDVEKNLKDKNYTKHSDLEKHDNDK